MLPANLPMVPFAIHPRKEWHRRMEKKARLEIIYDSDDESEIPETPSESSEESEESLDTQEDIQARIRSMLIENPDGGPPIYMDKEFKGEVIREKKYSIFTYPCRMFMAWRRRERERRVHYIIREYERRVKEYDEMLRRKLKDEIEAEEKAVMLEAYASAQRIKNSLKQRRKKNQLDQKYLENEIRRNKEQARIDFNVYTLQRWATEKHEEKLKAAADLEDFLIEKAKLDEEKRLTKERKLKKKADALVLKEDIHMTQEVMQLMREAGLEKGVNVDKKELLASSNEEKEMDRYKVEIRLRENVDFAEKRLKKGSSSDPFYPFDEDLQTANIARTLVAHYIGEHGALCLASELVRGACPRLEKIDCSHCMMKTRGTARLLHGIKIGRLSSLNQLILRGNDLTPRVLEFLKDTFDSGILINLQVLDLRENELGDEGADTLMRMIIADYFMGVTEILLQRNGITDQGFNRIIRALRSLQAKKCPMLTRVGLEGNRISPECKRENYPLPDCVSV